MKILIRVQNIEKRYGSKIIFDDASLSIGEGQKIGLIGRNGAGKSTLCKMIMGVEEADEGDIILSNHLSLAYLKQDSDFLEGESVRDYLERKTGRPEWVCGRMAANFQLKNDMFETKPILAFSGGYQTRVRLVEMLVHEPNFLLLDEPTNFLDLHTQILLEEFLKGYKGGYLVVSHDREFLQRTCEITVEAERGRLTLYPGKIEQWLEEKKNRVEHDEKFNQNMMLKQKQLQTFIDKNKAKAFGSSQARNKQKQLDRLQVRDIDKPLPEVRIKIPHIDQLKGNALQCLDLAIGYSEKEIARDVNLDFLRGSKVGIVGENGQGKTTFLKTIAEELKPLNGTFKWGVHIRVGYYAQHVYESLSGKMTIYDYLKMKGLKDTTHQEILQMAGNFLFRDDDLEKKVDILSGGEKARLCLAGLLLSKYEVLLLDEPNNHLDFETVEALSRSLKGFNGTIFFVSHDRQFVRSVANIILEIKSGMVREFKGSYTDYIFAIEKDLFPEMVRPQKTSATVVVEEPKPVAPKSDKLGHEERKRAKSELRKKEKILEELEARKKKLEDSMAQDPSFFNPENINDLEKMAKLIPKMEEEILELMTTLGES